MENRELDIFMAKKIMDWNWNRIKDFTTWHPTESILDAVQLVEKMVEDENSDFYEWDFELGNNHIEGPWYAIFSLPGIQRPIKAYRGVADTKELAICLAAKKAIEEETLAQAKPIQESPEDKQGDPVSKVALPE